MKKILLVTSALLITTTATAGHLRCEDYFSSGLKTPLRTFLYDRLGKASESILDFKKPLSILAEKKQSESLGQVRSRFDNRFETRMYFSATGKVNEKGEMPYVDQDSKAVYIFFHGSGTMASSGKNFYGLMNQLADLGISSVSFDMPFHSEGPIRDQFNDAAYFMKWVDKIVTEIGKSGKPIYLIGHSFGPDVISEYLYQNRHQIKEKNIRGALALSPAGFTKVLSDWYDKYTSKMTFGAEVYENRIAGQWSGRMSSQFAWNKLGDYDPANDVSVINAGFFTYRMLAGDREEYAPAPVGGSKKTPVGKNTYLIADAFKLFFKNAVTVTEPGVGHYLFAHSDSQGRNVLMRELTALVGIEYAQDKAENGNKNLISLATHRLAQKEEKVKTLSQVNRASTMYGSDKIFKFYIDKTIGFRHFYSLIKKEKNEAMNDILEQYSEFMAAFNARVEKVILNSDRLVPGFYAMNKEVIDNAKKSKKNGMSLDLNLYDYLKSENPETVDRIFEEAEKI